MASSAVREAFYRAATGLYRRGYAAWPARMVPNALAASSCMPGRTCWYVVIVNAGLECPSRSDTTLIGTRSRSRGLAWVAV